MIKNSVGKVMMLSCGQRQEISSLMCKQSLLLILIQLISKLWIIIIIRFKTHN